MYLCGSVYFNYLSVKLFSCADGVGLVGIYMHCRRIVGAYSANSVA